MRMSQLIAKCEDKVIANAPKAKAKAQQYTARTCLALSAKLAALAVKATPSTTQQG